MLPLVKKINTVSRLRSVLTQPKLLHSPGFFHSFTTNGNGNKANFFNPQLFVDEKAMIVDKNCPNIFFHNVHQQFNINEVPIHAIPKLPILNSMVERVKFGLNLGDLRDTVVIGAQHILETTVSLFKAIIDTGVPPENIWIIGKIYSTSLPVALSARALGIQLMDDAMPDTPDGYQKANRLAIQNMWNKLRVFVKERNIKRIIVLDDGGRAIELTPEDFRINFNMAVIEQTRGGLYSSAVQEFLGGPLIPVAKSAVKTMFLEPLMIAKALFRTDKAIQSLGINSDTVCGIIGNGAIGSALADYLLKKELPIMVYDPNQGAFQGLYGKSFCRVDSIEKIFANAQVIFGGTGTDITKFVDVLSLTNRSRDRICVSTTSEQNEFLTLLQIMTLILQRDGEYKNFNPLGDIVCTNSSGRSFTIKNMGYPFNFPIADTRGNWIQPWNVPAKHIQLTQCNMYSAFVQATLSTTRPVLDGVTINSAKMHSLDPYMQRYSALLFWALEGHEFCAIYPQNKVNLFKDISWIIENSGGQYMENTALKTCFEHVPNSLDQSCHKIVEETSIKPNYSHGL